MVRPSAPRALGGVRTGFSGADGLAGSSAVSGGGGAVVQPINRPKAISVMEYRFIADRFNRFQKAKSEFLFFSVDSTLDR